MSVSQSWSHGLKEFYFVFIYSFFIKKMLSLGIMLKIRYFRIKGRRYELRRGNRIR